MESIPKREDYSGIGEEASEKLYVEALEKWAKEVQKKINAADAIIGPACDILPDTYSQEITNYYNI